MMLRGEKWYSFRDIDGKLPNEIANDEHKMVDVAFFLEKSKPKTKAKVKKDD